MSDKSDFKLLVHGIIDGPDFLPRALREMTGLVFDEWHEKGTLITRKNHQQKFNYGSDTLTTTANSLDERNRALDEVLNSLVTHHAAIKACGSTSLRIWVAILESIQGNWAATPEQIQQLAAGGIAGRNVLPVSHVPGQVYYTLSLAIAFSAADCSAFFLL